MKKRLSILSLLAIMAIMTASVTLKAQTPDKSDQDLRPLDDWTFLQIGFVPGLPGATTTSNVYGLKLGLPTVAGHGRVYGFEPSILYSGTNYIKGIQAAWWGVCVCRDLDGLQAGPATAVARDLRGIQGGVVTVARELQGFQTGAVNVAKPLTGLQLGAVNVTESCDGLQLGVFNYTEKRGMQLGCFNIIEDGWLPFTMFFNVSF